MLNVHSSSQSSYIETIDLHTPSVLSPSQSQNAPHLYHLNYPSKIPKTLPKYHTFLTTLYDDLAQRYFTSELPYTSDYIFDSLTEVRTKVLHQLFKLSLKSEQQQKQYAQIDDYMDQKQRLVIEINKKKHQYHMKQELDKAQLQKGMVRKQSRVKQIIEWMNQNVAWYGQSTSQLVGKYMGNMLSLLEKINTKIQKKQLNKEETYRKQLQGLVQSKKEKLKELQTYNNKNRATNEQNKQIFEEEKLKSRKVNTTVLKLRTQLELFRLQNQEQIKKLPTSEWLTKKKTLTQTAQQLQFKKNEANAKILEVKYYKQFNPEIDRLQRKIEQIQRKCNNITKGGKSSVRSKSCVVSESDRMPTEHAINYTFRQDM